MQPKVMYTDDVHECVIIGQHHDADGSPGASVVVMSR